LRNYMKRYFKSITIKTLSVAPIHYFSRADLEQVGGKAANLGELVRAGFPVPPGFVVTTAAYAQFLADNELGKTITSMLRQPHGRGLATRSTFEKAAIPLEIKQNILNAYQQLGEGPVAVRSSATAEDLPEAAFAGQQDTYLNIIGPDALLNAVQRCWASLWTDRAIAYRKRLGIDQQTVKIAVVVQQMVAAEAAGVLFTANTITGARDEIMIDASPGLGEAIVSGLVTPDHFVLRKQRWGWRMVERQAGRQEVIIRVQIGGGTEQVEGEQAPALPDRVLRQLARVGTAIQNHFGGPQDIEWAWADGHLFILQARPITALPSPPPQANKLQRMLASNFAEMLPIRPYPLDMTTWIPALGGAVEPIFSLLGLDWHFSRMFEEKGGVVVRFNGKLPRPTWRILLAPGRLVSRSLHHNPVAWQSDPLLAQAKVRAGDLESRELPALSWEQLLATVHAAKGIPLLAGELRSRYFPRAALATVRLRLLLTLLGQGSQLPVLLSGAENKTVEANQALEELARKARADADLANVFSAHEPEQLQSVLAERPSGRAFLAELHAFLDSYGHREGVISTVLQPTWKDAPEVVLGIIKGFAAHQPRPLDDLQTDKPAWQAAQDELLQRPLLRFAPLRSAFLKILAEARVLLQIREDTHFYATLPMPVLRRTSLELGRRLVAAGVLDSPEDVFHIKLDELEQVGGKLPPPLNLAAEFQTVVMERKEGRARLEDTPLVDPRLFPQTSVAADALLRGTPGSPGVAEGPVRIVHDASEFGKLLPGEVLVAPYTNPAWTPLFQRAVAVVVDSGSPASHAAIVAREYGIPAVMATVTGTQTLHNGERIRVDGSQGLVFGTITE
jgi:rifampicin phosphotransferase